MNKADLQQILSTAYSLADWRQILTDVFGVRKLLQQPADITSRLSGGDDKIAEKAFELGSFDTSDGRVVGLYQVDLKDNVRIGQNRVGVRTLLRNIYKYDVDAALVVFVQGDKWRLSLISEIRGFDPVTRQSTDQKTEPKRFTYLLGENEAVRTARDRLFSLAGTGFDLETLIDRFSVEKLTKAFFKRYKELFGEFCEHITNSAQYRELFLNSRIKLKDGWEDPMAKPIRDFTKILLGRLVFLQFLQKKGWMGVPAGEAAWENGDGRFLKNLFERTEDKDHFHSGALRNLFFETLNRKRKDDLAASELGDDIRIPYLNGGLFDTDISTENPVDFPRKLFADLFDFFEQYNFTIDEDDPYDREVGIDPEMLGHIFENLLEENREKGAFYTPKEIVHYMCQESLIEYLATHLPEGDRPAIETLVRDNQVAEAFSDMGKAIELNRLLRDVKICDPAIGSGAFPMGLLKEIFECRRHIYPYLKTNETFDPARVKKEIIQNNIYGVDIDNGAVEIARLRFWLALVVDEIEPAPLPNLDYKIMQGNSLLEQFEDISLVFDKSKLSPDTYVERDLFGEAVNPQTSLMDVLRVQQELGEFDVTKLESEFFGTEDAQQKIHIREQLNRLERFVIEQAIKAKEAAMRSEITKVEADIAHKQSAVRADQRDKIIPTAVFKKLNGLKAQLDSVEKSKERLHGIRPDNKPYFLWRLYFQDVFEKGGFDIVIANPPYIFVTQLSDEQKKQYVNNFSTYSYRFDVYGLFIELAFVKLLKESGSICFINPHTLLNNDSFEKLRRLLVERTSIIAIIDLGGGVFGNAKNETMFFFARNLLPTSNTRTYVVKSNKRLENVATGATVLQRAFTLAPKCAFLLSTDSNSTDLLDKLRSLPDKLGDFCTINQGLRTGNNELYLASSPTLPSHKPAVGGRNISRYSAKSEFYVQYESKKLDAPRNEAIFKTPCKIIVQEIRNISLKDRIVACYDEEQLYCLQSTNVINRRPEADVNLKYLLALINSSTLNWFFRVCFPSNNHIASNQLSQLPIPKANNQMQVEIVKYVDQIINTKKKEHESDISEFEHEIDKLVYELYELTGDEIAIIEGRG